MTQPVPVVAPAAFTAGWLKRLLTLADAAALVRLETADGRTVDVTGYRLEAGELVLTVGGTGRGEVIYAALIEASDAGELLLKDGGMCRWHRRRDGAVVIRELIVLPQRRGQGIGRELVEAVVALNPSAALVRAVCPVSYPANGFWAHLGFSVVERSIIRNVWELSISSTAPTATESSPASPLDSGGGTGRSCPRRSTSRYGSPTKTGNVRT